MRLLARDDHDESRGRDPVVSNPTRRVGARWKRIGEVYVKAVRRYRSDSCTARMVPDAHGFNLEGIRRAGVPNADTISHDRHALGDRARLTRADQLGQEVRH